MQVGTVFIPTGDKEIQKRKCTVNATLAKGP